jgi:DNA repair photolyase
VDLRVNAPEVLSAELERLPVRPIKFCPVVSDPYQAVERRARLTRACLDAIREAERIWPTMLLTRSAAILEDLERIAELKRRWVGVSLPTIDDEVRRHFEPRAASVAERLEVLRTFKKAGVATLAVVQPLLPGSTDALAGALAEHADSVSIDLLRGVEGAEREFADLRFVEARSDAWQRARALALAEALEQRGVPVWRGELPPELTTRNRGARDA